MDINYLNALRNASYPEADLRAYFKMQFEFLSGEQPNHTIDFICFDNFIAYPLPVSKQLFNTLTSSATEGLLTQVDFIEGMNVIYNGSLEQRQDFLIKLFDFDHDGVIHLEDIEFLIIHLHSSSNSNVFEDIINHIKALLKEKKVFTVSEMQELLKSTPDLFYYFYISFYLRKPFDDLSLLFNSRSAESQVPSKEQEGGLHEYAPSEYLIEHFSSSGKDSIADEDDLIELTAFEKDICTIKNTSQLKRVSHPFHGFKQNYSINETPNKLSKKHSQLKKSSDLSMSFNTQNIKDTHEHMNALMYNEVNGNYQQVDVYVIGDDLYVLNQKPSSSVSFISLKQIYIQSPLNPVKNKKIALEENSSKEMAFAISLISNNTLRSKVFSFAFDNEDKANMFKDLIVYATNYSNASEYYEQIERIDEGAFGIVFKVKDRYTQQIYAQKVITKPTERNADRMLSIKYEEYISRLFVDISHPGIAKCIDIFEDATSVYIIQEYYSEGNLQDYFNSYNQQLSIAQIEEKLKELISSLQFLSKYGIVHRDLKMTNVLMANGRTVIIDFGLATILSRFETTTQRCGTIGYFAPEIIRNHPHNHSIDAWCLGVIGYYLLYGRFHYDKNHYQRSHSDIVYSIINEEFSFPKRQEYCTEEENIVLFLMQCLEKDDKQRMCINDIINF